MLTAFAVLAAFCGGVLLMACFDDKRSDQLRDRLEACEAEISRLQKHRDSRGRFTK
jgi:outer membrane murein-binding lipoprotein Lpp